MMMSNDYWPHFSTLLYQYNLNLCNKLKNNLLMSHLINAVLFLQKIPRNHKATYKERDEAHHNVLMAKCSKYIHLLLDMLF